MSNYLKRIKKLQKKVPARQAFLIADPTDIYYLTGFEFLSSKQSEREAYLVIKKSSATLIHSAFSPVDKKKYLKYLAGCSVENIDEALGKRSKNMIVHFNPKNIFASEFLGLEKLHNIKFQHTQFDDITQMRMVKDKSEQNLMKEVCKVSARILDELVELFLTGRMGKGITERELANLLEDELSRAGVRQQAFPTIVAFGENSALPHHQPTDKELEKGMAVLIDYGGKIDGYCADMSRSFWFGKKPDPEYQVIHKLVMKAYESALTSVKQVFNSSSKRIKKSAKKLTARDIDIAARDVIKDGGYGPQFIHTTGHGLGLDIHEQPSLNSGNDQEIKPGMTITIEPGIYLPGKFGVRYENTIVLLKNNYSVLTKP